MIELQYYTKSVYGNVLNYLADPYKAEEWERLTGKKTITNDEMETLTALAAVRFTRVFEPVEAR